MGLGGGVFGVILLTRKQMSTTASTDSRAALVSDVPLSFSSANRCAHRAKVALWENGISLCAECPLECRCFQSIGTEQGYFFSNPYNTPPTAANTYTALSPRSKTHKDLKERPRKLQSIMRTISPTLSTQA
jgi:hypothetical protein